MRIASRLSERLLSSGPFDSSTTMAFLPKTSLLVDVQLMFLLEDHDTTLASDKSQGRSSGKGTCSPP